MFVTKDDFDSTIYREIITTITRNDDTIIDVVVNTAMMEIAGYLAQRYNTDAIFQETGEARNPLILTFCKDIAIYHMHCIHNPNMLPQMRKDRYDRAIQWLKDVAKYLINPPGLPVNINNNEAFPFDFTSEKKRNNNYD